MSVKQIDDQLTVKDLQIIIIELERTNLSFDIEQMRHDQSNDLSDKNEAKKKMKSLIERRVSLLEQAGVADVVCRGEFHE